MDCSSKKKMKTVSHRIRIVQWHSNCYSRCIDCCHCYWCYWMKCSARIGKQWCLSVLTDKHLGSTHFLRSHLMIRQHEIWELSLSCEKKAKPTVNRKSFQYQCHVPRNCSFIQLLSTLFSPNRWKWVACVCINHFARRIHQMDEKR